MKIIPLTPQEKLSTGYTHKIIVTNADIPDAASGTKSTLKIFPRGAAVLPIGTAVRRAGWAVPTSFAGGSLSAMTVSLGDGSSDTALVAAGSVLTGQTPITYKEAAPAKVYLATDVLNAVFTPTGDKANAATGGELDVFLDIVDLSQFSQVK